MIQKPRGTQDYFGKDYVNKRELENAFIDFYLNKNYQGIETPIFESKKLFVRSVGDQTDVVQKQLFDLDQKSDDVYSLRPEFTAGILRSLIELGIKSMPLPVKVFTTGPCFRYERPQKGRRRQFDQLNIEVIGKKSPEIDADLIVDTVEFLNSINIKNVSVNINSLGSKQTRENYALIVREYLASKKDDLCELCISRMQKNPLRVLDCKNQECREAVKGLPSILDSLTQEEKEYFNKVIEILKSKEVKISIDPGLVRGLDYYTGIIFEYNLEGDESRMSSIGGGGRYDNLIKELEGPDMPALGMALGYERLIDNIS